MSSESKDVLNYLNEHFILTEISPYKLNTVFYNFESDATFPAELERIAKITDGVLRVMVIKK